MRSTRVLALLPLFLGLAHSSWDIVVGKGKILEFYYNGTLTYAEEIPSATGITSVTYDPVQYRVLFADRNFSISSYDLSTKKIQILFTPQFTNHYLRIVYDPVSQLLFWKDDRRIYSRSLKHALPNEEIYDDLLVIMDHYCADIAVDSCGRYIYWITDYEIERVMFDGSKREVLIGSRVIDRQNLAIDHQTQKMYWTETIFKDYGHELSIKSADINGKNMISLYSVPSATFANILAVSKDFIYWNTGDEGNIWRLPKNRQHNEEIKIFTICNQNCLSHQIVAANYTIQEQIQGIHNCKSLKSLIPHNNLCVHGTEVSGEFRCECAQGYTGESCDVSLCHNYCLQGDCIISAEGQPKCRCKDGFCGHRCEVNVCHKHCLNGGICSLNEDNEPICQCTTDYEGERCDVATQTGAHGDYMMKRILQDLRSEVKQLRKDLHYALELYSDKLDENAAKIQICEESMKDVFQNHDETTSTTSNTQF